MVAAVHIWYCGREVATLTTEHAGSRHGVPVLVVGGTAYGPDDVLATDELAREFVGAFLRAESPGRGGWAARTGEACEAAWRFVGIK